MANSLLTGRHNDLNFNLMHLDEWLSNGYPIFIKLK